MSARVGPADYFADGQWNLVCSICGRKMKSSEAVKNWQGMWRHQRCNDVRQPQDFVRVLPDDQTVPFSQPPEIAYVSVNIGILGLAVRPSAITTNAAVAIIYLPPDTATEFVTITYAWTWKSGGAGLGFALPTNSSHMSFSGAGNGVALCTITASTGAVGTVTVNVNI